MKGRGLGGKEQGGWRIEKNYGEELGIREGGRYVEG